jgi:ferredoxin
MISINTVRVKRALDLVGPSRAVGVGECHPQGLADPWRWAVKVRVDAEKCTGHGRCYSLAPEVYEPDDVGHSIVIVDQVPPELEHKARLGVENCPEQAISIEPD